VIQRITKPDRARNGAKSTICNLISEKTLQTLLRPPGDILGDDSCAAV